MKEFWREDEGKGYKTERILFLSKSPQCDTQFCPKRRYEGVPFDNGELVPHELTQFDGEPATCTEAGSREHWKCEACGNLFSDGQGENVTTEEAVRLAAI